MKYVSATKTYQRIVIYDKTYFISVHLLVCNVSINIIYLFVFHIKRINASAELGYNLDVPTPEFNRN